MTDKRLLTILSLLILSLTITVFVAWDGVSRMISNWNRDEYSYGYMVPFLTAFFIWQKKHALANAKLQLSWLGIVVTGFGLFVILFGELGTLFVMVQYGFIVTVHGIALSFLGLQGYRTISVPLMLLFFAVPLPEFLYNNLSQTLQLLSSEIGVWLLRLLGTSVYLEGNVIHLATVKLHVAEACSGLRYLFPLVAVGFMMAYTYRAPAWKRGIIFFSTIPIAVLMNSVRIGFIGTSVEYWGREMTDENLHDFEGWAMFMGSVGILLTEMWALNQLTRPRQRFQDVFHIHLPGPLPPGKHLNPPALNASFIVSMLCLLLCSVALIVVLPERTEIAPQRMSFTRFPKHLGEWSGNLQRLEPVYAQALQFDDHLFADYSRPAGNNVNLYAAYYASQRKGASVHSPRSCIPGDGWEITDLKQQYVKGVKINGQSLRVNRVVIKKGEAAQLLYYWFQQRGRVITNEFLVKWFLFQDALTRHRTDGALVRLTTPIAPDESVSAADERLTDMVRLVTAELQSYVPN